MLFSPAVGLTNTFVLGESSQARAFDFIAWYSVVTEMARRAGASPAHCRQLCTITGHHVRAMARERLSPPRKAIHVPRPRNARRSERACSAARVRDGLSFFFFCCCCCFVVCCFWWLSFFFFF